MSYRKIFLILILISILFISSACGRLEWGRQLSEKNKFNSCEDKCNAACDGKYSLTEDKEICETGRVCWCDSGDDLTSEFKECCNL